MKARVRQERRTTSSGSELTDDETAGLPGQLVQGEDTLGLRSTEHVREHVHGDGEIATGAHAEELEHDLVTDHAVLGVDARLDAGVEVILDARERLGARRSELLLLLGERLVLRQLAELVEDVLHQTEVEGPARDASTLAEHGETGLQGDRGITRHEGVLQEAQDGPALLAGDHVARIGAATGKTDVLDGRLRDLFQVDRSDQGGRGQVHDDLLCLMNRGADELSTPLFPLRRAPTT